MGVRGEKNTFNHCRTSSYGFQLLLNQNGNAQVESSVVDSPEEMNIYRSNLAFQSITTEFVGKYYCVYNNSIKDETKTNYDFEVVKFKASSIYIFVDGESRIKAI